MHAADALEAGAGDHVSALRRRPGGRGGAAAGQAGSRWAAGGGSGNPDMPYLTMPIDQYVAEANRQTFLIVHSNRPGRWSRSTDRGPSTGWTSCCSVRATIRSSAGSRPHGRASERRCQAKVAEAARRAGKNWDVRPDRSSCGELLDLALARLLPGRHRDDQERAGAIGEMGPLGFTFENASAWCQRARQAMPIGARFARPGLRSGRIVDLAAVSVICL